MSRLPELQQEIKELKKYLDDKLTYLNNKYASMEANGITVLVMHDPLHCQIKFCVDLGNLKDGY